MKFTESISPTAINCLVVVRDEYKEFEKLIQEDLQEVDDRFEEEEVRVKT